MTSLLDGLFGPFPGCRDYRSGRSTPFDEMVKRDRAAGARFAKDLRHCGPGYRSQEERIGYPDLTPYTDPELIAALPVGRFP